MAWGRPLLDDGVPLMRMAASAVADTTMRLLDNEDLAVEDSRIVVLAGAGDNGGDGLYAGALLAQEGAQVTAVAVGRSLHDAAFAAFVHAGGRVLVLDPLVFPLGRPGNGSRRPWNTRKVRMWFLTR